MYHTYWNILPPCILISFVLNVEITQSLAFIFLYIPSNRSFALSALAVMNPFRILTIQVEVNYSRRLAGSSLLIPCMDALLVSHTCLELLQQVLNQNFDGSDAMATVEEMTLFCSKESNNNVTWLGPCRSSTGNASACMNFTVLSIINICIFNS